VIVILFNTSRSPKKEVPPQGYLISYVYSNQQHLSNQQYHCTRIISLHIIFRSSATLIQAHTLSSSSQVPTFHSKTNASFVGSHTQGQCPPFSMCSATYYSSSGKKNSKGQIALLIFILPLPNPSSHQISICRNPYHQYLVFQPSLTSKYTHHLRSIGIVRRRTFSRK
jgi:hypothetical protein